MGDWVSPSEKEQNEIREADEEMRRQQERLAAERRTAFRMKLHAKVTLQSQSNFFMGLTENVSEGGVFVSSLSPPGIGETVELSISVEDSDPIPVSGTVRWIRMDDDGNPTGCGVQFDDLDDDVRRQMEMLLVTLEKEPLFHDV